MENYSAQIKALMEERKGHLTSLDNLVDKMSKEKRAFTDAEQAEYDKAEGEVESINARVKVIEKAEKRALEAGMSTRISPTGESNVSEEKEKDKMYRDFSWKRALKFGMQRGQGTNGIEAELDKEERKNMAESGVSDLRMDSILVPAKAFERRDMTAGTTTQGGHTIQTNVEGIVDVFLPEMCLGKVPVVRMNNLRGDVKFPQASTLPSATWDTENATATEKSPAFGSLTLSPKRLAAYIQLSSQLLQQSESNISAYARKFLVNASAIEFEKVCLVGAGSNEPTGIIGGTGYSSIYAGGAATNGVNANGLAPVWADMVNHVKAIKAVNSPDGQAYITSPAMKGKLQITGRQASGVEGNYILRDYNSGVNGFPMYATTNLPDTFTKGGSVVLSAIIFGDFSNFVMASWGGMEIGVDPYVNMKEGLTNIVLNSFVDCGMLNPAAFSVGKDYQSY